MAEPGADAPRAPRGRRFSAVAGAAIVVACGWFVVKRVVDGWSDVRGSLSGTSVLWLAVALVLAGTAVTAVAANWVTVLRALDSRIGWHRGVAAFYVGEAGKYLPGGIWPIVGRAELARREGETRGVAYSSVVLSLALGLVSAAVWAAVLEPVLLVVVVPAVVVVVHPAILRGALRLVRRESAVPVPSWSTMLRLTALYVGSWTLTGLATVAVCRAFDASPSPVRIIGATAVSWAIGFLAVPVPSGAGVREAVFIATAGLPSAIAGVAAITARLLFVLVDAIGAAGFASSMGVRSLRRTGDRRAG